MLRRLRMLLTYANVGDVTLMEYVVRLRMFWTYANVGVMLRRFVVVAGTQQLDSTWKVLKKWKPIAFAQKDKSHGGNQQKSLEMGAKLPVEA